jgi:hypothetical protein
MLAARPNPTMMETRISTRNRFRRPERSRGLPDMGRHGRRPPVTDSTDPYRLTPDPAEGSMSAVATPVPIDVEHRWELRLEEFEDGHSVRRYECVDCGAVRFE